MTKCECCGKKTKDLYGTFRDKCWECFLEEADMIADVEF